ncbi:hypothetical protein VAPA_1c26090 [Variovorax paradoxus B4]|uniref:Uncharacterized protein n=1 Tax=Variovorax paradoxus B4 TaxID=1246301 RepID=T1X9V0_VARPD|nr:hypothetical protein [Variovorax paradoxus]AGU49707.1 hypothetical protein VAPA_1c26090 [Variovorax paradoxus B4]
MNTELSRLAAELGLNDPGHASLRLAFGLACADRIGHLLEDPRAIEGLSVAHAVLDGKADEAALTAARAELAAVANGHRGSNSIDGSAHAAVSATYAVANALAGRALEAASYAAYAAVYAYGGYAITDPTAFEDEFAWQVQTLETLAQPHASSAGPAQRVPSPSRRSSHTL